MTYLCLYVQHAVEKDACTGWAISTEYLMTITIITTKYIVPIHNRLNRLKLLHVIAPGVKGGHVSPPPILTQIVSWSSWSTKITVRWAFKILHTTVMRQDQSGSMYNVTQIVDIQYYLTPCLHCFYTGKDIFSFWYTFSVQDCISCKNCCINFDLAALVTPAGTTNWWGLPVLVAHLAGSGHLLCCGEYAHVPSCSVTSALV